MAKPSGRRTSQFKLPQGQPQPSVPSAESNFIGGLKTEFTGLNFPENACTATDNCVFNRVGNVTRRSGIDYESNFSTTTINRAGQAISSFLWTNAGGQGNSAIYVLQVGTTLYFYQASNATSTAPLSTTKLGSTVSLINFQVGADPSTIECQYTAGNGYLFVFHPSCDPFYCTFSANVVTANKITVQIRDFIGIPETIADNVRPAGLSAVHNYNLLNQGWAANTGGQAVIVANSSSIVTINPSVVGTYTFQVTAGLPIVVSNQCTLYQTASFVTGSSGYRISVGSGTVIAYAGTSLTINISSVSPGTVYPFTGSGWEIDTTTTVAISLLNTWFTAIGSYPSNSDIWWTFKDTSNTFNPSITLNNVTLNAGPAPKGYYILSAFLQQRSLISNVGGLNDVVSSVRPRVGTWFQGRVWYAGVDASQVATGTAPFYTWTENIYFSQIVTNVSQLGKCYQTNDPTSETLSTLLPSDGGVIQIQGCGSIYKLVPVVNGLLVFAANGIWFISGNQGIGFTANDYSISKISGEHALSSTSFVDAQGWPIFWNADGIYMVQPGQAFQSGQRSLEVKNLTLPTIKQFYLKIPLLSKLYARGSYNHITGVIQWVYRSTVESDVTSRYNFDSVLNLQTLTEAFYTWSISPGSAVHDVTYVEFTGSTPSSSANAVFKYLTSTPSGGSYKFTFSEERDNITWTDWTSTTPVSYTSTFTTSYKLKGHGQRKAQPQYIFMYSETPTSGYTLKGIWDFAASNLSNRYSGVQVVNNNQPLYFKGIRKHRIRGNGYVLQYVVSSLPGQPFNISGWSVLDTIGIQ